MLILKEKTGTNFFNIDKKFDKDLFKIFIKNKKNPIILLKSKNYYDILNNLFDIAFEFKKQNIKNNNNLFIVSNNKNIKEHVLLINNCMKAIDLSNLPANIATPLYLVKYIKKLFKNFKDVKVKVLNKQQIKKENLNLLYAIGKGNSNPPYFVIIERLIKNKPVTCITGKGITFDNGGITIKSGDNDNLHYMKLDKLGACYSIYIFKHIIETIKDKSIVAILPLTENILSNKGLKPGDIIKSHSGKTVEITDTDAEGRLVIADSLSYLKKYKPNKIIDITTLTSTSISCDDIGIFFTENKRLKDKIENISYKFNENIIGLPTYIQKDNIYSTLADIKNYSKICSDSYNASMFLHEFIPKKFKNWVHIDITNEIFNEKEIIIPNGKGFRTIIEIIKK